MGRQAKQLDILARVAGPIGHRVRCNQGRMSPDAASKRASRDPSRSCRRYDWTVISRRGLAMFERKPKGYPKMIASIHSHARAIGLLACLAARGMECGPGGAGRHGAGLRSHCRGTRPGRCRPSGRSAPPARQNARLRRRQAGHEGAGYGSNAGYSTELLARAGAHPAALCMRRDSAAIIERFVKDKFDIRAQKPAMKNVVHVIRNFDHTIPPDVSGTRSDHLLLRLSRRDLYGGRSRRDEQEDVRSPSSPGGFLVITNHSAHAAKASRFRRTMHRIKRKHAAPGDRRLRIQAHGRSQLPAHPETTGRHKQYVFFFVCCCFFTWLRIILLLLPYMQ